jgi:YbbR domain-containing protein
MDKEGRQELIIKICCVVAAFVLWLFITSTENPVTAYKIKNIPVQILNTDSLTRSNLVLVPGQELFIDLSIKGANTSMLLDKKVEDFTVVADLGAYALKTGQQKIPIEIKKSPDNINVLNNDSLFITINLDELIETKLPISLDISGKPKEGFYASEAKLSEKFATVVGGSKFVNLVKKVLIEEDIEGLESDITKAYKLIPVDAAGKEVKEVTIKPPKVDVNIPVRKTKSVGVTAKTTGEINTNFKLGSIKVAPERFDITGSAAELNKLESLNTEAIDLSKITNSTTTMEVKVIIPDGLSLVSGDAQAVVKVVINLNKVVKKELSVDIKYINLDPKYEVKLASNKDKIVISGTEASINALVLTKITATLDLATLVEGEHTLLVKLNIPEGINLLSQVPDKVLVTITKKQTEVIIPDDNKVE